MFQFHKNHKSLVTTSLIGFISLSILIAVLPARQLHNVQPLPGMEPLSQVERAGLEVYVAENCVACHTQQVRNIEMDMVWGSRPSIPSDYHYSKKRMDIWRQSPSILGTERTGPDLTDIGTRQPSTEWHLLHMYNPRAVVEASIMPSYPWLFDEKAEEDVASGDVVVRVPEAFLRNSGHRVVATEKALNLVAYLKSLKQPAMPGNISVDFIPAREKKKQPTGDGADGAEVEELDGGMLYTQFCAACHQENGTGLEGAFPPLAGSAIVQDEDFELMVRIILQGYDARSEYAVMVGFADLLSDEEIAAITNHERTSWGNNASPVTAEDIAQIRDKAIRESL